MAQPSGQPFASLSDVEVLLHEDKRSAAAEFRRRTENYTPEQRRQILDEYQRRKDVHASRDGAPLDILFERINSTTDPEAQQHAFSALRRAVDRADDVELLAIQTTFRQAWAAATPPAGPPTRETLPDLLRLHGYLRAAGQLFPDEEQALPLLEEHCLESGIHAGYLHMLNALANGGYNLGPLTAARMEALYHEMLPGGNAVSMGGNEVFEFLTNLHNVLGRCGLDAIAAMERIGTTRMRFGVQALGIIDEPEAESLLWETLESTDIEYPSTQVTILQAIYKHQLNRPDPDRLTRMREPMLRLLELPGEGDANPVGMVEDVVGLAAKTGDTAYLPRLIALENETRNPAFAVAPGTDEEGRRLRTPESLKEALRMAIETLERPTAE